MKGITRPLAPIATDVAVAIGLTIVNVASILPYRKHLDPLALAVGLVVLESAPLVGRRAWPVPTFMVIGAARVLYDVAGFGWAPVPLSLGFAVFTVADRCGPRARRLAGLMLLAGIVTSQVATPHDQPYDVTFTSLFFVAAWIAGVASRTRRVYTEEVELRARRAEADQDNRAARAADNERSRIARELHDVVAHHVSLIAVQAEAAGSLLPARPVEAAQSVDIIGTTARQALTELRRLLGVLRGPDEPAETEPSASVEQLEAVVDRLSHAGLDVDLTIAGTPRRLSPAIDLTAYRIVQEALTNVVRHAPGHQVRVVLSYEPDQVSVTVSDAGDRPTTPSLASPPTRNGDVRRPPGGFGLAGITERVTSCGGTLTVGPVPGGGFAVLAKLPAP